MGNKFYEFRKNWNMTNRGACMCLWCSLGVELYGWISDLALSIPNYTAAACRTCKKEGGKDAVEEVTGGRWGRDGGFSEDQEVFKEDASKGQGNQSKKWCNHPAHKGLQQPMSVLWDKAMLESSSLFFFFFKFLEDIFTLPTLHTEQVCYMEEKIWIKLFSCPLPPLSPFITLCEY